MINYNCRPYIFTIGIASWIMMVISVSVMALFIYGTISGSKLNAFVISL